MTTKKDLFTTLGKHLNEDKKPSVFIEKICVLQPIFDEHPFNMLKRLKDTPQNPKYHPEGNVWNHTMLVVDNAAKVKGKSLNPLGFMWTALLHDIGKPDTTKVRKGRITSYNHDKVGKVLTKDFLQQFNCSPKLINYVSKMVLWHMQPLFISKNMPFSNVEQMKKEVPMEEIHLLSFCDRLGRGTP